MKNSILATIIAAALVTSCGKSESTTSAEALLAEAQAALDAQDTNLATSLLDSLDRGYASETGVRKQALAMRPKIVECETLKEITTTDSLMAYYADLHARAQEKMKCVNNPQLVEPYYVAKVAFKEDFVNTTGVQARVDEIGQFYMVSSLKGNSICHTSVTITADGGSATTATIPYDGEANYRIDGSELVTYMTAQCDTVGKFAATHRTSMGKLTFNGKRNHTIQLSPAQMASIADAWDFAQSIVQSRELSIQREKLERKLQIARDQAARQLPEQ
ncbi:MAG: hypothetical protein ACI30M_04625 [Muribaculaceae bacterium]